MSAVAVALTEYADGLLSALRRAHGARSNGFFTEFLRGHGLALDEFKVRTPGGDARGWSSIAPHRI
jgi:hypothetical protein